MHGTPFSRMYRSTCSELQSASGLRRSRPSTSSALRTPARVSDCSRRSPSGPRFQLAAASAGAAAPCGPRNRTRAVPDFDKTDSARGRQPSAPALREGEPRSRREFRSARALRLHHLISLFRQATGVQSEHAATFRSVTADRQIDNRHPLFLEAGGDCKLAPIRRNRPVDHFAGRKIFQFEQ
jgi:hypothetical protein